VVCADEGWRDVTSPMSDARGRALREVDCTNGPENRKTFQIQNDSCSFMIGLFVTPSARVASLSLCLAVNHRRLLLLLILRKSRSSQAASSHRAHLATDFA